MNARDSALLRLRDWIVRAERLPARATLLEPVDSSAAWWAIRHPRTGALFGWHADPDRLVRLYWQALGEDQRADGGSSRLWKEQGRPPSAAAPPVALDRRQQIATWPRTVAGCAAVRMPGSEMDRGAAST